jgi:hypothetical protein
LAAVAALGRANEHGIAGHMSKLTDDIRSSQESASIVLYCNIFRAALRVTGHGACNFSALGAMV